MFARGLAATMAGVGVFAAMGGCSLLVTTSGLTGGSTSEAGPGVDAGAEGAAPSDGGDAGDGGVVDHPRVWRKMNVSGPAARHSVRMVFHAKRGTTILVGGVGGTFPGNETWEWNGAAWSRPTIVTPPAGTRKSAGLTYATDRNVVLLFGGGGSTELAQPWEWDGGPSWTATGTAAADPAARYAPALAFDSRRNVAILFGGGKLNGAERVSQTWEWTLATGFQGRDSLTRPPARLGHVMVFDTARGRTVVFGGDGTEPLGDTWEWDGKDWMARVTSPSPAARVSACAAYDSARGKMVIFGGRTAQRSTSLADTWEWDGSRWTEGPTGPPPRRSCAMAYDSVRDAIVLFGGASTRTTEAVPVDDTWIYQ